MDRGQEIDGEPIVSGGHATEVLQSAEHAFDGVSVAIEDAREHALPAPVHLRGDVRHGTVGLDLPANGVRVVTLVGVQDAGVRQLLQEIVAGRAIGDVAAGEQEGDGSANPVGQGVDLGRPAAARPTDRLRLLPPLPPAAER
jgi:hypothetical protein